VSEELIVSSRPELERPILIAAFRGWNDGGQGASLATGYLAKLWNARRFAEIEPENFFDFQATRPHVSLEEGVTRRIDWPSTVFYHGRPPDLDRDVVLLLGIEPNLRWRTFSELIVGFLQDLQIELVISLGSLLADVPHTRPCPVTGAPAIRSSSSGSTSRVALRRPDRDRRRAPRRVPAGRSAVGEPLGSRSALRLADAEPESSARTL
jgi:proteasome assembly chaperone (PAC2) family protein